MSETETETANQPGVIRITHEEARSAHVEDLLKRQMSLLGEVGITRNRRRRWYYQNWFVFMIAGMLAAIAAWAIIEPFFGDTIYWQGAVSKVQYLDGMRSMFAPPARNGSSNALVAITINNETVLLFPKTTMLMPDGSRQPLDMAKLDLESGKSLGLYIEIVPTDKDKEKEKDDERPLIVAPWVVVHPNPAKDTPASATLMSLEARHRAAAMLLFPLVAACVGLAIGAVDGIVCRVPRRALLAGGVGLLAGFLGGFVSHILASLAYAPLTALAMRQSGDSVGHLTTFGFMVQLCGRGLAWCIAGMAMGLGQGIALRSWRLLIYGFIGGILGGLLGGILFDPIYFLIQGGNSPSAHWSRFIGLAVIGAGVGAMIGIVELLARDAWLRMLEGPLAGKEFLIFKDTMRLGSAPSSDIYLFNDPDVAATHAVLRATGDHYEMENMNRARPALVNGRPIQRTRLRHGDQITLGRTVFVFNRQNAC